MEISGLDRSDDPGGLKWELHVNRQCQSLPIHSLFHTFICLFILFHTELSMRLRVAISLLALPACLREAFVAASSEEALSKQSDTDPLDRIALTDACPDYAQYSRVRQYGSFLLKTKY